MARTAVVNRARRMPPRNRDGSFKKRSRMGRAANPRRKHRRRRRNPAASAPPQARSPYASVGYYRSPNRRRKSRKHNPEFSLSEVTNILPAATGGVIAARWAVAQSGAWEPGAGGVLEPGIKQALAIYLAATIGSDLIGQVMGSDERGRIAKIAAYGYGGDLFMRTRFMKDSPFFKNNLSLQGMESQSYLGAAGGDTYTDAEGNVWHATQRGWQLAGLGEERQLVLVADNDADEMSGMESQSYLGYAGRRRRANPSASSSFGYAPAD